MGTSYDIFTEAFLAKVTEYELTALADASRTELVDGYMKRAISGFSRVCKYDLTAAANDGERAFSVSVAPEDMDEIVDIVSEGMLVQWLKPYIYRQELLENSMNTKDFITYSPAELLMRVGNAYAKAQKDYRQMVREYSYNHAALSELHL